MRVFLDTNVLVSAVATRGICADVFREVLQVHELITSPLVLTEVIRVLNTKVKVPDTIGTEFIQLLTKNSWLSKDTSVIIEGEINIKDQDDLVILNSALAGNTEIFVTGNKELLAQNHLQTMKILSPRQFWELIRS